MVAALPLVGRDAELSALGRFFGTDGSARLLLLAGEPGIGKTALWEAGVAAAEEHGMQCLRARTSEAEAQLSFAGLVDLLDPVDLEAVAGLPGPQLRALEVAIRRAEPAGTPPDPLTIATGFLNALRSLASHAPVLVAVDDIQWLDPQSADVLAFAARRLTGHAVRFLLSRRSGPGHELERAFEATGSEQLEVSGLSFGAVSRLLSGRLGLTLPRRVLRQVFEITHGNPLFALELGRTLVDRGVPEIGAELPLPGVIEDLFGARVSGLAPQVRRVLLAVGLSGGLSRAALAAVADPLVVEDGVASGLLLEDRAGVRASHALLAAAAVRLSDASERRHVHLALAGAVSDETLRARHLAVAALGADGELAATIAEAARLAVERGAAADAVELAGHAVRLTPPDTAEYSDRVLELGRALLTAGEMDQMTELLGGRIETLPAGRSRAVAHLLLAEHPHGREHIAHAIAESAAEPGLRAWALAKRATELAIYGVEQIAAAETVASEALAVARSAAAEVEARALVALAWTSILGGHSISRLLKRAAPPAAISLYEGSIERPAAVRLAFRGEVAAARAALRRLSELAEERGEALSAAVFHVQQCELELRAGDVHAAALLLDDWDQWTGAQSADSYRTRLQALLDALRGATTPAALEPIAAEAESRWDLLEVRRAIGIAALCERDSARAAVVLSEVWAHTAREGVDDPGAFPVAADLVEALVDGGQLDLAREVLERLARLSVEQRHPWGLATAKRCEAMIELASGLTEEAATSLADAAAAYEKLGMGYDHARSLLFLGRVQRRAKKRADARRSLEAARSVFVQLGCDGWAEQARSELERVSGRPPATEGELTPSERRVVELAASGLSNKEIAAQLVISVYTVEGHLKHAYAKLGVRSRNQLAAASRELG